MLKKRSDVLILFFPRIAFISALNFSNVTNLYRVHICLGKLNCQTTQFIQFIINTWKKRFAKEITTLNFIGIEAFGLIKGTRKKLRASDTDSQLIKRTAAFLKNAHLWNTYKIGADDYILSWCGIFLNMLK